MTRFVSRHDWQRFMPTGVVTDVNWWVDGHAKKHRQQYLERLPYRRRSPRLFQR